MLLSEQGAEMTLIERLRSEAVHPSVTVQMRLIAMKAADALQTLQAENERLREMYAGLKKMVDDGSINERTYSAGIELERLNTELRSERDALAAKLASLQRYEPEIWREDRIRMEPDSQGDWVKFSAIDAAKGGQHEDA